MQAIADMDLVQEYARSSSDEAFRALVTRHVNLVYSAAWRKTGSPDAAQEITQAVFIILARKAGELHPNTVLSGWLYHTTRLTAANFLRTEIRRTRRESEAFMQSVVPQPETECWPHIAPLLEDAMGQLGEADRNAIALRFFEDRNFREVGAALGTGEDAAKMRVSRALEKLRRFFAKRGVASTTAGIAGAMSAHSVQAAPAGLAGNVTAVAAAKGAAAGGSTLTLVKGAIKLMAWTKTKITIVAAAVILLAAGTITLADKSAHAARNKAALATMQGNWAGALTIGQARLRLVLRIFETNGAYNAVLDSPDQGARNIPVANLSARPHFFHGELPALGAGYEASLSADGTQLSGTFTQLGKSFPLALQRTAEADLTAPPLTAGDYAPRVDSDLQGEWAGALQVAGAQLRLNLKIAETSPGTFRAALDSVDQGVQNLPVTALTYQKPDVHFQLDSINGRYEGTLDGRDEQLSGTWTQAGKKFPLTFKRVSTNVLAEAVIDYGNGSPYQVQGHWKGALTINNVTLHLVFHIGLTPEGDYAATLDSPDQGASGLPASSADYTYPNVRLEWKAIGGVFKAQLKGGRLAGTWSQGKISKTLELERETAN